MNQFDDVINLIKIIIQYLKDGRMKCNQLPIEDIIIFVEEGYNAAAIDDKDMVNEYRELLEKFVYQNDIDTVCAMLRIILNENMLLNKLYYEKISKYDLDSEAIPCMTSLQYYKNLERNRIKLKMEKPQIINSAFKGKGVVYSAVTGGYDSIRAPKFIDNNLDYVLFTDSDTTRIKGWETIKISNDEGLDDVRLARRIKIIGGYEYLSEYDYTIWIDGKLQIIGDISQYINKYSIGAPMLCFNHYVNDDIYEEAEACLVLNRDAPDVIKKQIGRYRADGYPEHSGLIDSCMLVRDNRDEFLKKAMYAWWDEVKNGSKRDQLSFNYVCWKNSVIYDTSPLVSFDNEYVKTYDHA